MKSYRKELWFEVPTRQDKPEISRADFTWCMTAIDWSWSVDDTANRLLEESAKAQNGERYATELGSGWTPSAANAIQSMRSGFRPFESAVWEKGFPFSHLENSQTLRRDAGSIL